jgi:hypothetical protein
MTSYKCASCGIAGFPACTDANGKVLTDNACNDKSKPYQDTTTQAWMCPAQVDPGWADEPCGSPNKCQAQLTCVDNVCKCTDAGKYTQCDAKQSKVCQDASHLPGPSPPPPGPGPTPTGDCPSWPGTTTAKAPTKDSDLCKLYKPGACGNTNCAGGQWAMTMINGSKPATTPCADDAQFPDQISNNWDNVSNPDPTKYSYCYVPK